MSSKKEMPPRGVYPSPEEDAALAARSPNMQFTRQKLKKLMLNPNLKLPETLDWRAPNLTLADGSTDNTNKIVSVGDQGPCGACYMFAILYQFAAYIAIHAKRMAERINVNPFLSQCACTFAETCANPDNKHFTMSTGCTRCGGGKPHLLMYEIATQINNIQSTPRDAYVKYYNIIYPFASKRQQNNFNLDVAACMVAGDRKLNACLVEESLSKTKSTVFQLKKNDPLFISDDDDEFNVLLDQKIPASTQSATIALSFTACLREKEQTFMFFLNKYGPLFAFVTMEGLSAAGRSTFDEWPYVYTGASPPGDADHVVLIIGYTRIQTQLESKGSLYDTPAEFKDVWIVQNSWGKDFGNHGIFYLPRGTGASSGWTQKDWLKWQPHGPLNFLSSKHSISFFYSGPKIQNDCEILYPNSHFARTTDPAFTSCTKCITDTLDLDTHCTTCKDPLLSASSYCVRCSADESLDPATNCAQCFSDRKLVDGKCDTCIDALISSHGYMCNECTVWGKDPFVEPPCSACLAGHVPADAAAGNDCYSCAPGWLGGHAEGKLCVPGCAKPGMDPGGNVPCSECYENWGPPQACTGCVGGYDPLSYPPCSVCKANYDADCKKCQTNWDPAKDCQECLPGYDAASNCTTCLDGSAAPCKHLFQCDRDGKQLEQDMPQQARGWCTQEEGCCETLKGTFGDANTWQSVYCSKFCENFNCPSSCMESCTKSGLPSPTPYIRGYSLGAVPEKTLVAEYIKANPDYVMADPTDKLKLNASLSEKRMVLQAIHDTPAWTGGPNTVDYVSTGKVAKEVVNQSDCGACAIFSATAALESWIAIDQDADAVVLCIQPFIEADRSIPHDTCNGQAVITAMKNLVKHCVTGDWLRPLNPSLGKDNTEDSWMWKTYFLNKWEVSQQCTKIIEDDLTATCTSLIPNHYTSATTCPNREIPGKEYIQFKPTHVILQSMNSLKSIFCGMFKSYGAEYDRREAIYEHALRQYGPFPVTMRLWPNPDPTFQGCIEKLSSYMDENEYSWLDPVAYLKDSYTTPHGLHAVLLVGYSAFPDGRQYWVIKNSWGSRWGCKGFAKIPKGRATWTLPYNWDDWSDPTYGPFDITQTDPMFYAK